MLGTAQLPRSLFLILITIVAQTIQVLRPALSSSTALSPQVLFLRKQLLFYQEHQVRPRQLTDAARVGLVFCHDGSTEEEPGRSSDQKRLLAGIGRGSLSSGDANREWGDRGFPPVDREGAAAVMFVATMNALG
jgi:hypothetical protein